VFHSSPKSTRSYQKDVPFLMVGDPKKAIYTDFGVESSLGFMSLKTLGPGCAVWRAVISPCDLPGPLGAAGRLPDRAVRTDHIQIQSGAELVVLSPQSADRAPKQAMGALVIVKIPNTDPMTIEALRSQ
jgi:hypothetical protein